MKKGLLILYTGNGKGKTTAALGVMLRAWGRNMRICMLQFLKNGSAGYGEYRAAEKLGISILPLGDGCTWESKDLDISRKVNLEAWEKAKQYIISGSYDLLVLDEFTFLMHFEWLDVRETVDWILNNQPEDLHLIITGRFAPEELIQAADLVTDMVEVKHPYQEQGLISQPGVDR
jgi:cob(I)alamin adenosyltransferase